MLNKLIEQSRHKCARYWPEKLNEPMIVSHHESDQLYFTVTLEGWAFYRHLSRFVVYSEGLISCSSKAVKNSKIDEEKSNRIFVKRRLHLVRCEKDGDDYKKQSRTVTHFHYVAWPDFGVPETPDEFAQFFDLLHEHRCFTDPDRPRYTDRLDGQLDLCCILV